MYMHMYMHMCMHMLLYIDVNVHVPTVICEPSLLQKQLL